MFLLTSNFPRPHLSISLNIFFLPLWFLLQALSDFCSEPNMFVLNSTQTTTGTSSGMKSTEKLFPE